MENALNTLKNPSFISAILLTIVLIFIGFIFVRTKLLKPDASKVLSTIVMKIAFPCLAFSGFMSTFQIKSLGVLIVSFLIYIVSLLIGRLIFIKSDKAKQGVYRVLFVIGQVTLFGLPISQSIYGDDVLLSLNMVQFSFRIFLYIYSFFIISEAKFTKETMKKTCKDVFLNPIMIGMFLGVFIWASQNFIKVNDVSILRIDVTVPWLYKIIHTIGNLASPIGMLLVGTTLGRIDLKSALTNKVAYILSALKSFLAPLIAIGILLLYNLVFKNTAIAIENLDIASSIVICFASPISVALTTYCVQYEKEPVLASDSILISTIMSIVSVPIMVLLVSVIF